MPVTFSDDGVVYVALTSQASADADADVVDRDEFNGEEKLDVAGNNGANKRGRG